MLVISIIKSLVLSVVVYLFEKCSKLVSNRVPLLVMPEKEKTKNKQKTEKQVNQQTKSKHYPQSVVGSLLDWTNSVKLEWNSFQQSKVWFSLSGLQLVTRHKSRLISLTSTRWLPQWYACISSNLVIWPAMSFRSTSPLTHEVTWAVTQSLSLLYSALKKFKESHKFIFLSFIRWIKMQINVARTNSADIYVAVLNIFLWYINTTGSSGLSSFQ